MKNKSWFKPKVFTHLTPKLGYEDQSWVEKYVSYGKRVGEHKFFPLIHRTIFQKKLKKFKVDALEFPVKKYYTIKEGQRISTAKFREVYYANHLDSQIYAYYSKIILEPLYEAELIKNIKLNESVIAYRRIPVADDSRCKCNIDFANEVFEEIRKTPGLEKRQENPW
jgi:hypothetical protein